MDKNKYSSDMKKEIKQICTELNDGQIAVTQATEKLLNLFSVSVSDSSDFELQRLFDWLQDAKREPAQTKFTAGMTRNVAREFEYLLKHSR